MVLWVWAVCAFGQEFIIKFATVAPEGSTWMNIMRDYDAAVRQRERRTDGISDLPRASEGDEGAVLRKIRVGQLQAGGFTGVGMGDVAPMVRILGHSLLGQLGR